MGAERAKIPDTKAWSGDIDDFEGRNTREMWFGKSLDEMQGHFSDGRSIQRAHELLNMPRPAYQFYIFALAQYLLSDRSLQDGDAASSFLGNLSAREKHDPGSVAEIYERLAPAVSFVAASQARYDADRDIYGDFAERGADLAKQFGNPLASTDRDEQMLDSTDDA